MKLRSKLEELEERAAADMNADPDQQSLSHGTKERIVELQQQENQALMKHYASLQQKVVYLIDRSIVFRHFHAWKSEVPSLAKKEMAAAAASGSADTAGMAPSTAVPMEEVAAT